MGLPDFLHRCVSNLVDNAIKYSGEGSTVSIDVTQQDDEVSIAVADNGPGIEADDMGRIFHRFYRVEKGRNRRLGGAGLGLSIVSELMAAMQGTVGAHSQRGEGSTFTLTLNADDSS